MVTFSERACQHVKKGCTHLPKHPWTVGNTEKNESTFLRGRVVCVIFLCFFVFFLFGCLSQAVIGAMNSMGVNVESAEVWAKTVAYHSMYGMIHLYTFGELLWFKCIGTCTIYLSVLVTSIPMDVPHLSFAFVPGGPFFGPGSSLCDLIGML